MHQLEGECCELGSKIDLFVNQQASKSFSVIVGNHDFFF